MKTLALLVVLSCGAPVPELAPSTAPIAEMGNSATEVPVARCYCCWPGGNRCRFTRASSAPADVCEADPDQRCVVPDAGRPAL